MSKEYRTYRDRADYHKAYVKKRRLRLKLKAIEILGGKCCLCGYHKYSGALDFHHMEGKKKMFNLNVKDMTMSWDLIIKEINKCALLCSNCHREFHGHIVSLPKR